MTYERKRSHGSTPFLFPSLSHHQCQVKIANIYHGHLPSNVSVISAGSGPGVGVGRCWSPRRCHVVERIEASIKTLAPAPLPPLLLPLFSPLHFSGTPAQSGQYSIVLGECLDLTKRCKVKVTEILRLTVARPHVMWTRVLPEPRCPELEQSPLPPRRPVASYHYRSRFYRRAQRT
jgi:hypothetical protein